MTTDLGLYYRPVSDDLEFCYYVESSQPLTLADTEVLKWLLAETYGPQRLTRDSRLVANGYPIVEIGPRLNFATAFSTNAVSICHACGLNQVIRLERSRRLVLELPVGPGVDAWVAANHDRMVECVYPEPLTSLTVPAKPKPVREMRLIEDGPVALRQINQEMGLGMDDWDIEFYHRLFVERIGRNPTDVECFQLGQANSEHSRHWYFKGRLEQGGRILPHTLLELIQAPLAVQSGNSVIAFGDNASAIQGYETYGLVPAKPGQCSQLVQRPSFRHPTFNAETHNFPSGVAPFPGAETGTGGRIRDGQAVGRGGHVVAATVGYCVGNLSLAHFPIPGETAGQPYPNNLASPLAILIGESNGSSDYGNKFGEPVVQGFTRTFGQRLPSGERREWLKPIMFSGGVGQIDDRHVDKESPAGGMMIVQVGGPAYRIGMGGGAASSMIQGDNAAELDFNAVQRGDAEMAQKVNRVIRACIETGSENPILSIHDQGAGGPCNVLTELVAPAGGEINLRAIRLGDRSLSVLEIWGAEYQERNALLIDPGRLAEFSQVCSRERAPLEVLGYVTDNGRIVVTDRSDDSTPVDLDLREILCDMPQKTFNIDPVTEPREALAIPANLNIATALKQVMRLPAVGSKGFLVRKVDRSVTGLVAQQQCCGPFQLPVADVAAVAHSHFDITGTALSTGEQPIKMLVDPAAGARMAVGEALTNLVWARVSRLEDIKCSVNWMWAAKLPGEGAKLYSAAVAASTLMTELGIAPDGGKDSLSMAARVDGETVKAPGQMVVSAYVNMSNVNCKVTPDIKRPGESLLVHIDLSLGGRQLGGSALAQTWGQIGAATPDVRDAQLLKRAFQAVQVMVDQELILAGHDISDGGLITCLVEMALAGESGLSIKLADNDEPVSTLFAEELGLVIEVADERFLEVGSVLGQYRLANHCRVIGRTEADPMVTVSQRGRKILDESIGQLLRDWEAVSDRLENEQMRSSMAATQRRRHGRTRPIYRLSFEPKPNAKPSAVRPSLRPQVAIVREEGSNGDREMAAAFYAAEMQPVDVTMSDLLTGRTRLDDYRGVAFVGGFSYADVLDSAKGWAGSIRFNPGLREQFDWFRDRPDTFSLGVCNGCQLMALLGWVPWPHLADQLRPRFVRNWSERFESRWVTVRVEPSPAIMLSGMAGSVLGVWVAHGEGRLMFPDSAMAGRAIREHLAPLVYVDDRNQPTESYPFNPNSSVHGITALCSSDGRHLAMMPHPERAFLKWQWPWMPAEWQRDLKASPWVRLFQNARTWCDRTE